MNWLRHQSAWRALVTAIVVTAPIIVASMLLVRFRNRDREDSKAIAFALNDVHTAVTEQASVIPGGRGYVVAVERFQQEVALDKLPVDSVRHFYQAYALVARDGMLELRDLRELAPYFGIQIEGWPAPVRSRSFQQIQREIDSLRVREGN